MKNREIIRRAWGVFRKNWGKFAAVGLIVGLGLRLGPMLCKWITGSELPWWGSLLYSILLGPVTSVGMTCVMLGAWRRGAPEIGELFSHLGPPARLGNALGLSAVLSVFNAAGAEAVVWPVMGLVGLGNALIGLLLLLIAALAWAYLSIRLSLAIPALALDPDAGVLKAIATGWRASKRSVRRIIGLMLAVGCPTVLLVWLLLLVHVPADLIVIAVWTVYMGFVFTAFAGLAQTLIEKPR